MAELTRLRWKGAGEDWEPQYPADIADFQRILRAAGYEATDPDVEAAWQAYSGSMSAGWMMHDHYGDADVLATLLKSLEPCYEKAITSNPE